MPFVSSVRGTFGATSENRGVSIGGILPELVRQNPNSSSLPAGGTITKAGGYRIHTYTTPGADTFVPVSGYLPTTVEVIMWGGGGAAGNVSGWSTWSSGGSGGFATGSFIPTAQTYRTAVAGGGQFPGGGVGGGGNGSSWGNGGGGGLSGLFTANTYSQANALLIAGGGGGGGTSRTGGNGTSGVNRGGGGGGTNGQDGTSVTGGYQGRAGLAGSAGAASSGGGYAGGALQGGNVEPHGAGGGGGYWGGGGGGYLEPNDMGGGGGGSGFASGSMSSVTLTASNLYTLGNSSNSFWSSNVGQGNISASQGVGGPGKVVIRYLI